MSYLLSTKSAYHITNVDSKKKAAEEKKQKEKASAQCASKKASSKANKYNSVDLEETLLQNIFLSLETVINDNEHLQTQKQSPSHSGNNHQNKAKAYRNIFLTTNPNVLPFASYFKRVVKYLKPEISTLIITLIYLDEITSNEEAEILLKTDTIHKLFFIAFTMATKFNEDICCTAKLLSKVAGIPVADLIRMEAIICQIMNFNFYVSEKKFNLYFKYLLDE